MNYGQFYVEILEMTKPDFPKASLEFIYGDLAHANDSGDDNFLCKDPETKRVDDPSTLDPTLTKLYGDDLTVVTLYG